MPDPTRTSRTSKLPKAQRSRAGEQPERQPERQRDDKPKGPLWARAVHRFYDPVFDIRSRKDFQEVLNDFVELTPDERAFHDTHLLYSVVVGLEGIFGVLKRIEERLAAVSGPDLAALEHLAPIRAALEEIASGQPDLVRVEGVDGDDEEEDEDEDDEEEEEDEDELGEEDEGGKDPDFIYDTVPDDEPKQPRRPRRPPAAEATRPQPQREPLREPQRPSRAADPEREALVGELVPASEGPHGEAGER